MRNIARTLALLIFTAGAVAPAQDQGGTDGHYAPRDVRAAYAFKCEMVRAALVFRQQRFSSDEVRRLEDGFRVTLIKLSVSGRKLSAADFRAAADMWSGFAWVARVDGTCYRDRLTISVEGMPLAPFIDSINNDKMRDLPDLRIRTLRLSRKGVEHMS